MLDLKSSEQDKNKESLSLSTYFRLPDQSNYLCREVTVIVYKSVECSADGFEEEK